MKTLIKVLILLGIGVNVSFGYWYLDTTTYCEPGEVVLGNSNNPSIPPAQYTKNTFVRACIDAGFFMNQQDVIVPKDFSGSDYKLDGYVKGTYAELVTSRKWSEFVIDYSYPVKKEDSLSVSRVPKYRCETCTTQIGWTYKKIKRDSTSCMDFLNGKYSIPFEHKEKLIGGNVYFPEYKKTLPYSEDISFVKFRMACPEKVVLTNKTVFTRYKKGMDAYFPDTKRDNKRKLVDYTYGKEPPPEHTTNIKKVVFDKSIQDKIFLINGRKFYK